MTAKPVGDMPADIADKVAAVLLGQDPAAPGPVACTACGTTTHTLIGGRCTGCWAKNNDGSATPVKQMAPSKHGDGKRAVA